MVLLSARILAAAERRFFHQRGIITSTPRATPAVKVASTTSTSGACQSVPKKKFTETTCWLFSAKANSVKKNGCFEQPEDVFHGYDSLLVGRL